MARGGIRLVHGHTKSTQITYFSGMKIDPKYAFLHAFFLICPSCPLQNLSIWPKTHPFFPILHVFAPLNDVRAYSVWSWKPTLITWIFGWAWYPLDIRVAPPPGKKHIFHLRWSSQWFIYYLCSYSFLFQVSIRDMPLLDKHYQVNYAAILWCLNKAYNTKLPVIELYK